MNATDTYVTRNATDADADTLRALAELDSQSPIAGPALIGEIDGAPAAALCLADGRITADPFQPTAALQQVLRARAQVLRTHSRTPSLSERGLAALGPFAGRATTD